MVKSATAAAGPVPTSNSTSSSKKLVKLSPPDVLKLLTKTNHTPQTAPLKVTVMHPGKQIKVNTTYCSVQVKINLQLADIKIKIKSPKEDTARIITALEYFEERLGVPADKEIKLTDRNPKFSKISVITPLVPPRNDQASLEYFIERPDVAGDMFEATVVLKPVAGEENLYEEYDPTLGLQQAYLFQYSPKAFKDEVLILTVPVQKFDESDCETTILVKAPLSSYKIATFRMAVKPTDSLDDLQKRIYFYTGLNVKNSKLFTDSNKEIFSVKDVQSFLEVYGVFDEEGARYYDLGKYHYYLKMSVLDLETKFALWKAAQEKESAPSAVTKAAAVPEVPRDKSFQVRHKFFCDKMSAILLHPFVVDMKADINTLPDLLKKAGEAALQAGVFRFKYFMQDEELIREGLYEFSLERLTSLLAQPNTERKPLIDRLFKLLRIYFDNNQVKLYEKASSVLLELMKKPQPTLAISRQPQTFFALDEKTKRLKFEDFFTGDAKQLAILKESYLLVKCHFQQKGASLDDVRRLGCNEGLAELYNDNCIVNKKMYGSKTETHMEYVLGENPKIEVVGLVKWKKEDSSWEPIDIFQISFNLPADHASKKPGVSAFLQAINVFINRNSDLELTTFSAPSLTAAVPK